MSRSARRWDAFINAAEHLMSTVEGESGGYIAFGRYAQLSLAAALGSAFMTRVPPRCGVFDAFWIVFRGKPGRCRRYIQKTIEYDADLKDDIALLIIDEGTTGGDDRRPAAAYFHVFARMTGIDRDGLVGARGLKAFYRELVHAYDLDV